MINSTGAHTPFTSYSARYVLQYSVSHTHSFHYVFNSLQISRTMQSVCCRLLQLSLSNTANLQPEQNDVASGPTSLTR